MAKSLKDKFLERRAGLTKHAYGLSLAKVLTDAWPLVKDEEDAKDFVAKIQSQWEFQTAKDGSRYRVDTKEWDALMNIVKKKFPKIKTFSWFDSEAYRQSDKYPSAPPGGVQ